MNCLQLAGYSIFQPDRMRRHASGSCDAALNLTEGTLSSTSNASRSVPNKMKNISQRPAAVKYSVVIRVFDETLQRDCVMAFNPSIAHNLITKTPPGRHPENCNQCGLALSRLSLGQKRPPR